MKNKYKDLSKNVILFTISTVGTKLITFLLVPLYTNYLSTEEYGIIDLVGTITSIALPVLTLSLESAVLRFCLDKRYETDDVYSVSCFILLRAFVFNLILIAVFEIFGIFEQYNVFLLFYFFMFFCTGIKDVLTSLYRGTDKLGVMVETSFLNAIVLCGLNILLLTVFQKGIVGYIFANVISSVVTIVWGCLRINVKKHLKRRRINKSLLHDIQLYGGPLIFNQIGWWLNNSVDKYIVIYFMGMAENGIYSIAYKIPTILSIFSSVFSNAWSLSAIKEFDSEDAVSFSSNMYKIYNLALVLFCSVLLIFNSPIAKFLFAKEFYYAWEISGILIISTVFNGLSGFLGAFFSAAKDTRSYAVSTIAGGVINVIISLIFVNLCGTKGVALGTLISYICIWGIRLVKSREYIKIDIPLKKHGFMYILLSIECFIGMYGWCLKVILVQSIIVLLLISTNYNDLRTLFERMIMVIKRKDSD